MSTIKQSNRQSRSSSQEPNGMSRRNFLSALGTSSAAIAFSTYIPSASGMNMNADPMGMATQPLKINFSMTPEDAMQRLMDGNKRYIAAKAEHPAQTAERRVEVAKHQAPFAAILGCIDSRVPPEIVFDQGLGDLFVMRTAAGVLADVVVGSIEFAVAEYGIPLVIVLGHERCGAVSATIDALKANQKGEGHISSIVTAITPAVKKAESMSGDLLDNTVSANAKLIAEQLAKTAPILAEAVTAKKLSIVAARYDLDDGVVQIL
jgi:carbonic anhydrase